MIIVLCTVFITLIIVNLTLISHKCFCFCLYMLRSLDRDIFIEPTLRENTANIVGVLIYFYWI